MQQIFKHQSYLIWQVYLKLALLLIFLAYNGLNRHSTCSASAFRSSAMPPSSDLLSMGSVRTAKAERRMKEKLQHEVGTVINQTLFQQVATRLSHLYKLQNSSHCHTVFIHVLHEVVVILYQDRLFKLSFFLLVRHCCVLWLKWHLQRRETLSFSFLFLYCVCCCLFLACSGSM
jgi:hypothetical protein